MAGVRSMKHRGQIFFMFNLVRNLFYLHLGPRLEEDKFRRVVSNNIQFKKKTLKIHAQAVPQKVSQCDVISVVLRLSVTAATFRTNIWRKKKDKHLNWKCSKCYFSEMSEHLNFSTLVQKVVHLTNGLNFSYN